MQAFSIVYWQETHVAVDTKTQWSTDRCMHAPVYV